MATNAHDVNWFEIPVVNLERATAFYNRVLATELSPMEAAGQQMQAFSGSNGPSGALVAGENYTPSTDGCTLYLNSNGHLAEILDRVETAGGQVVLPKTNIGEHGFIGQFIDTEGNRVALHETA